MPELHVHPALLGALTTVPRFQQEPFVGKIVAVWMRDSHPVPQVAVLRVDGVVMYAALNDCVIDTRSNF
jgi:hypothetical protein